ncbi:hypothetical protein EVA_02508 [gut metagenome]|uniref:Uncharacterized protein n=1 Tax=gut metagenome TaxID=749906 RepID=J9GNX2_9ZZZZ
MGNKQPLSLKLPSNDSINKQLAQQISYCLTTPIVPRTNKDSTARVYTALQTFPTSAIAA